MLASGEKHDGRAPDYDDWELNGDIIVYYPVLDIALELSSMGIRVDEESLKSQLKTAGCEDRAKLPFQKSLLDGELPYTVGGGIGQSRICMYYLRKAHIGEVHSSMCRNQSSKPLPKTESIYYKMHKTAALNLTKNQFNAAVLFYSDIMVSS